MKNNMNYPLISVITVSYNAVLTIEQTILSVINQTYLNIEYIIIDGGSTDGTVNVIKKYADKIAYWVSESDKGIYDAMNKGIAYSHGEYCNFINAGDKFCSSSILKQVMDFNHVADIIVGQDLHVNEHNKIVSRSVLPRRYNLLHFYITTIPHQSCFIRASLLKKYYYDTSLKIVSDWKFYLQSIVLGGHSVAAYNNVIVICNPRGASSDNNRIKEEREKVLKDLLPAYIVNDYQCLSCLGEEFIENALFLFNNHWIRFLVKKGLAIMVKIVRIFMKIVVFKGGLGNQLFQYAFYKYLSRKDETFYFYNDAWYNVSHNGFELDKYFKTDDLKKCSRFWIILFKTILSKLYHWKIYVVGSVEYQYPNHLFQAGYFLDKKYYDENTIDFKHLLLSEKNQSLLKDIQNSNSVGVHIRRGDYMTKQNLVIFGNICTQKYYHDAIRIITEKVNDAVFYVFSDDISWVQTHLDIPNAVYVNWNTGESSIYDMYLMSSCKYNIIANSTFSYWAARLNKKTNMVIYPSKWYNTFTPDIFPESWCGI